jgi:hypothetical protein
MSVATNTTSTLDRASETLGTAMMIAWTLGIGLVGFGLLLVIAYALVVQSKTLAVVCSLLLFAPLMITILWGTIKAAAATSEKWSAYNMAFGPSWWERRTPNRVLYQAYFF